MFIKASFRECLSKMSQIPIKRNLSNYTPDPIEFVVIDSREPIINQKFRRKNKSFSFIIKHNLGAYINLFSIQDQIVSNFQKLIDQAIDGEDENSFISVEIYHNSLGEVPIYIGHQKIKDFNVAMIFHVLEKYSQSNKLLLADGKIEMDVIIVENVRGGGGKKVSKAPKNLNEISFNKLSTITIKNKDNTCGFRALFVSLYHSENRINLNKNEWRWVREDKHKFQTKNAAEIAVKCGLEFNTPIGNEEWVKIQSYFTDVQINVVDSSYKSNFIFKGPYKEKRIYIEYIDNHYNSIININAYMGGKYYCEKCNIVYWKLFDHICPDKCIQCYSSCGVIIENIDCEKCNRNFKNELCYKIHIESNLCKYIHQCSKCSSVYKTQKKHECKKYWCKSCHENYTEQPHYCNIKPKNFESLVEEDNINKIIVAYDIEATQENREHIPNLLIRKTVCDHCIHQNSVKCEKCFIQETDTYFGRNCIKYFVNYLFEKLAKLAEKTNSFIYAFAHNARGYDGQFILREVWNRNYYNVDVVMRGRKILFFKCGNVKMLDSLNFFLQPLDQLPKALGLDILLKKGDFPHLFNKQNNYNYIGKIPDLEYFGVEYLNPSKKQKIEKWHSEYINSNDNWNFKEELIKYCKNDVEILSQCIIKFRKDFRCITDLDPITRSFTLASIGLEVFKSKFLNENNVAITPVKGYSANKNHSKSADCWLDCIEKFNNVKLIREFRIGKYWVDGFDVENNTIYEFNGCKWHGHDCTVFNQEKFENLKQKLENLEKLGYKIKSIWECEFKNEKNNNTILKNYFNQRYIHSIKLEKYGHANIRESFFGGRTNNLKFLHFADANEEIKYLDFCSLYPYVLKNRKYPIGHPLVIREDFDYSLNSYFGFVKCKIIPPKKLYLPVLPLCINNKLMFPLCYFCAKNQNKNCVCIDREIVNTWTSEELKKAVEKGYKIVEIYEVLHYEDSQCSDVLFKQYVDMWLKIKQQASGWPSWCSTEEAKMQYIEDYFKKENITLEYDKIEKNEGLRFIAKIMLNSFWGKLAQKPNQQKTAIVNNYNQYFDLIINLKKVITGELMVNEDTLLLNWEYALDSDDDVKNYNIAVSSYVTAWARLKLYDLMEQIENIREHSLLYHDTDSVLYVRELSDPVIECGDYLGELTDEIKKGYGEFAKCIKFVSLGPKNYAYVIDVGDGQYKTEIKCKGIFMSSTAREMINFDQMVEQATAYFQLNETIEISIPQRNFDLNRHCQIFTRYFEKIYKPVSEKRVIFNNFTLPYGY